MISGAGPTSEISINGFLVKATVTPISLSDVNNNPYIVPTGKNLYILNVCSSTTSSLFVDGVPLTRGSHNVTGLLRRLSLPIVAGANSEIAGSGGSISINGYLINN